MASKTQRPGAASVQKKDVFLEVLLVAIRLLGVVYTIYFIYLLFPNNPASALQFTYRPLHTFGIVSIILLLILLIPLNRPKRRSHVTLWFTLYVLTVCVGIGSVLLSGLAANYTTVHLWTYLVNIGIVFIGPALLLFVLAYLGKEEVLYRPVTIMSLVVPSTLLFTVSRSIINNPSQLTLTSTFGFEQKTEVYSNPLMLVWISWIYIFAFASFILLYRHYRKVKQPAKKKQAKLLLIAISTPFIFTFIATIVTPLSHYVSLAVYAGDTIEICIMTFAILKYGLFNINPATLADTILGTMNEAVLTTNSHLEIESANKAASVFFGKPVDDIEGRNIQTIMGQEVTDKITQKLKKQETDALEANLQVAERVAPTSIVTSTIFNTDKSVAGHVLVFRDITKERAAKEVVEREVEVRTKQLHEEQARLQASIDSLQLGYIMAGTDGTISLLSVAAKNVMFGNPEQVTPASLAELKKQLGGTLDLEKLNQECVAGAKPIDIPELGFGPKFLHVFVAPITLGQPARIIGSVIILEDITDAKAMQRSRDEFFSIASHELRTPLTTIQGNMSLLKNYYPEVVKQPDIHEIVDDVYDSTKRLIQIVNDFLDTSRLEQGRLRFEPVALDVLELAKDVAHEFDVTGSRQMVALSVVEPTTPLQPVLADKIRLRQIIVNLVGNSFKFTEKGSINITLSQENGSVKVSVTDTGRGIAIDKQHLLFRKFQQATDDILTRDNTRSTGLGLYVSKLMIDNMGGKIWLERSEEGKGSTFSLTLPVAPSSTQVSDPVKTEETPPHA